ncbi:MAG TPA: hypothetical protein VGL83_16735 [Stellaceae bacterium]
MQNVDLATILAESDLTIEPSEHDDEREVRLHGEKRAKLIDDIKGLVLFFVVLLSLLAVGALCAYVVFFDKVASAELQKFSQTGLTVILSGGVSFLLGKSVRAPSK